MAGKGVGHRHALFAVIATPIKPHKHSQRQQPLKRKPATTSTSGVETQRARKITLRQWRAQDSETTRLCFDSVRSISLECERPTSRTAHAERSEMWGERGGRRECVSRDVAAKTRTRTKERDRRDDVSLEIDANVNNNNDNDDDDGSRRL